ncbi:uncharacterized protein LOC129594569 isoform X2 [Paramacrobiotus metropolitanus]|uniref:uncharacterized protein LOC129594569 isoform X2 n=1 Tax=Paramacrobiotus metropolitanus TaxID=2943436 RepID=UPI002445E0E5|nr:uncharacterized protein LOC129594569 isoform X2 [Paramacrobiotus metropolitanus]XP_055347278.1 uncharacterized protein LOC129594569 isoform X2 [Paramacrobiotus metropolitanus]XP_055347279.1 uncharacterized protein LOC129594569 isoform X2 [Paramacrobiotus metropolitanus]
MSVPHGDLGHSTGRSAAHPDASAVPVEHAHNVQKAVQLPLSNQNKYRDAAVIAISREGISYTFLASESHAEFPTTSQIWKSNDKPSPHETVQLQQEKESTSKTPKKNLSRFVATSIIGRSTSAKSNAAHCSEILDEPEVVDLTEAVSRHDKAHSKLDILQAAAHDQSQDDPTNSDELRSKPGLVEKQKTGFRKYWKQLKDSIHRIRPHEFAEHK